MAFNKLSKRSITQKFKKRKFKFALAASQAILQNVWVE